MKNPSKIIWSKILTIVNLLIAGSVLIWWFIFTVVLHGDAFFAAESSSVYMLVALFVVGFTGLISNVITLFSKSREMSSLITLITYGCILIFSIVLLFNIEVGLEPLYFIAVFPVTLIAFCNYLLIRNVSVKTD